jgi:hypothetical protein
MRQHRPLVASHFEINDATGRVVEHQHGTVMRLGVLDGTPDHTRYVAQRASGEDLMSAEGGDRRCIHVRPDVVAVV